MKIEYKTNKLEKICNDIYKARKEYGKMSGDLLLQRMSEFDAAISLLDISYNRANGFHKLKGKRSNEFAVYLQHPYRLVFSPVMVEDVDINDLDSIRIIRIEEVTDYHGKGKRK